MRLDSWMGIIAGIRRIVLLQLPSGPQKYLFGDGGLPKERWGGGERSDPQGDYKARDCCSDKLTPFCRFSFIPVFDPICIFIIACNACFGVLVLWPALRTFKDEGISDTMGRMSVDSTDLLEVLNSNLYYLFLEHLKSEFSVENCVFWKACHRYKVEYGGGDEEEGLEGGEGGGEACKVTGEAGWSEATA